jgi:hypothetical protein
MNNDSQGSPPTAVDTLLEQLRREVAEQAVPSPAPQEQEASLDEALLALISQATPDPSVFAAVDALLGQEESLPTRDFQVRASQSVASVLAKRRQPLPTLLEVRRTEAGKSIAEIARDLAIPEDDLCALEVGRVPLWDSSERDPVPFVIAWIRLLKVDANAAARAAKHLVPPATVPAYARRSDSGQRPAAEEFVTRLLAELGGLAATD